MTGKVLGVVGGGAMGAGIAHAAAAADRDTVLVETTPDLAGAAGRRVLALAERAERTGRANAGHAARVRDRLVAVADLSRLDGTDLVVEAVPEDLALKQALIRELDDGLPAGTVIASNTSSIPIASLAAASARPDRVIGLHFFNPVDRTDLVEVTPALQTADEVTQRATAFVTDVLGRTVIRAQDRAGFVVNALLVPFLLSAVRMVESRVATPEDVDAGMVGGCNHPMGPLRLCDLIGLDVVASVAVTLHEEFQEPHYAPPALLRRMVAAGRLGRKTGRGFYDYA